MLKQSMGSFLAALEDVDLNVRRVALVAFNSAAHNKPMLIRDLLDSVLPKLYHETKIKVLIFESIKLIICNEKLSMIFFLFILEKSY